MIVIAISDGSGVIVTKNRLGHRSVWYQLCPTSRGTGQQKARRNLEKPKITMGTEVNSICGYSNITVNLLGDEGTE